MPESLIVVVCTINWSGCRPSQLPQEECIHLELIHCGTTHKMNWHSSILWRWSYQSHSVSSKWPLESFLACSITFISTITWASCKCHDSRFVSYSGFCVLFLLLFLLWVGDGWWWLVMVGDGCTCYLNLDLCTVHNTRSFSCYFIFFTTALNSFLNFCSCCVPLDTWSSWSSTRFFICIPGLCVIPAACWFIFFFWQNNHAHISLTILFYFSMN